MQTKEVLSLLPPENIILFAHATQKTKEFLIAHPEYEPTPKQIRIYERYIQQHKTGKPIAYILNNKEFYGKNYFVTQDTLIPRPETELLIELALNFINFCEKTPINILEIGTGSGCIPITLLDRSQKSLKVVSVDISAKALVVARKNRKTILSPSRAKDLKLINADIFDFNPHLKFDLIISNPPYITKSQYRELDVGIRKFEPKSALVGGNDGLKFYYRLRDLINTSLAPSGKALFEMNSLLAKETSEIFSQLDRNRFMSETFNDLQGKPRVILVSQKPY